MTEPPWSLREARRLWTAFFEDRSHSQQVDSKENRITSLVGWRAWEYFESLDSRRASHRGNFTSVRRGWMPWLCVRASCSGLSSWTHSLFVNPGLVRLLLSDVRRHCSNRIRLASSARPPILR